MTTLVRRDPLALELPSWFNRTFNDLFWGERLPDALTRGMVPIEEFTDGDVFVLRAELAGIDPEKDVEVTVHDGLLHIKGERREQQETTDKAMYRSEFRYGMFERTVPLPAGATEKDVTATYEDGVLEVRVPTDGGRSEVATVPVQRTG